MTPFQEGLGVCSLAIYSVAYEETQSNRVSDFRNFVFSLFPKTITVFFFFFFFFFFTFFFSFIAQESKQEVTEVVSIVKNGENLSSVSSPLKRM